MAPSRADVRSWIAAIVALVAPFVAGRALAQGTGADFCVECHRQASAVELRQPAEQVPVSAHRNPAIGCVGCHGGDPADPTVRAHAADAGYVGKPASERIATFCGGCHGDARFVRRLNAELPIDQLVLYGASRHGELAASGDDAAPTCISCHGHHDTLGAADPRSPVHPRRVAELCASCHADPEKMARFSLPTGQRAQWERSAHAEAFRRGTPRAPTCTGCHGSHGGMPSGVASVASGCPTCHEEQHGYFLRSPHAEPFRRQGFTSCVPCHGTHDVLASRPLALAFGPDGSCSACHAGDEAVQATIDGIAARLSETSRRAETVRARLERARRGGLHLPLGAAALAELHTAETRLRPAIHTFDSAELEAPIDDVERAVEHVRQIAAQAEGSVRIDRTGALLGVALLAVLSLLLLWKAIGLAHRRGR